MSLLRLTSPTMRATVVVMSNTDNTPSRADCLRLAAEIGVDPRTARRALERGPDALRSIADRERARDAIPRLGLDRARSAA